MENMLVNDIDDDKPKEECGVFGIFTKGNTRVSSLVYYGLFALQHRGQESAGITASNNEKLISYKEMGLVSDVFNDEILYDLKGNSAIGHVRYSTTGESKLSNSQPLLIQCKYGELALAHNGNIVNCKTQKEILKNRGSVFHTTTDSEIILNLIADQDEQSAEDAIIKAIKNISGSFALVLLTKDKLIGVRDPNGIRPLCIGKISDGYVVCSESCALNTVGAEFIRDVKPGEMIIISNEGMKSIMFSKDKRYSICAFEYIYFAREDSIIDGINIYSSRNLAGEVLYNECPAEADLVIGVPESGIPAAIGYSKASGIPFDLGFVKNRYVTRTFIKHSQPMRKKSVSVKLNPLRVNIEGKRIVVVDDSLVRGTTSMRLVESLKNAGAKEVHFRVASPMVKCPCYFGIDILHKKELIGSSMNIDEIREYIGADSLGYLSIDGLQEVLKEHNGICTGCFNGEYPVDIGTR